MLRLLVVACALGLCAGFMGPGKMVKKFAYGKVMESCFGEANIQEWKEKFMASISKCRGDEVVLDSSKLPSVEAFLQSLRQDAMKQQQMEQQRPMAPLFFMPVMAANSIQGSPTRGKRQVDRLAEKIRTAREEMISKMSNLTCIFQDLNLANEDLSPNVEYWRSIYEEMDIDESLKEDMLEVVDCCSEFATCMPVEKAKNPIVQELGRLIIFMKCEHMHKGLACMKNDMRKHMGDAVLEAEATLAEQGISFGDEGDDDPMTAVFELMIANDMPIVNMI